ncbi:DMT family transporter [Lacticaseibacillus baoqingensis]|uniref:DMT family transporter n=1 Tax=Lacticaseibacillus baoqingensis TaxID=2486013 RepID=A0ABW4E5C8_9LACO|nr:DMT family transporter [Lacticaseibacillus baoqingensis]
MAILIGLIIGFGIPVQTAINSRLRDAVGSPFWSSLISFAIGTIGLAIATALSGAALFPSAAVIATQPWWLWLGGVFGVVYLTSNILLFPKLGSVQTVIFPVTGQILMGLLIDNGGWFAAPVQPLTLMRGIGALLVVGGVLITVALPGILAREHDFGGGSELVPHGADLWLWRLLGVVAGMLSASQTAVNGHLGVVLQSTAQSALISFAIGTVVLVVIVALLHPHFTYAQTRSTHRWWMWLGGLLGATFVLGNAYLAPTIGTGLAVVIVLVGLMVGSLAIDQFGWLAAPRSPVSRIQLLGLFVMILGVVAIRLL